MYIHTVPVIKKLKYLRSGSVTVRSWFAFSMLLVRSRFALGTLESAVRCGSGSVQSGAVRLFLVMCACAVSYALSFCACGCTLWPWKEAPVHDRMRRLSYYVLRENLFFDRSIARSTQNSCSSCVEKVEQDYIAKRR